MATPQRSGGQEQLQTISLDDMIPNQIISPVPWLDRQFEGLFVGSEAELTGRNALIRETIAAFSRLPDLRRQSGDSDRLTWADVAESTKGIAKVAAINDTVHERSQETQLATAYQIIFCKALLQNSNLPESHKTMVVGEFFEDYYPFTQNDVAIAKTTKRTEGAERLEETLQRFATLWEYPSIRARFISAIGDGEIFKLEDSYYLPLSDAGANHKTRAVIPEIIVVDGVERMAYRVYPPDVSVEIDAKHTEKVIMNGNRLLPRIVTADRVSDITLPEEAGHLLITNIHNHHRIFPFFSWDEEDNDWIREGQPVLTFQGDKIMAYVVHYEDLSQPQFRLVSNFILPQNVEGSQIQDLNVSFHTQSWNKFMMCRAETIEGKKLVWLTDKRDGSFVEIPSEYGELGTWNLNENSNPNWADDGATFYFAESFRHLNRADRDHILVINNGKVEKIITGITNITDTDISMADPRDRRVIYGRPDGIYVYDMDAAEERLVVRNDGITQLVEGASHHNNFKIKEKVEVFPGGVCVEILSREKVGKKDELVWNYLLFSSGKTNNVIYIGGEKVRKLRSLLPNKYSEDGFTPQGDSLTPEWQSILG